MLQENEFNYLINNNNKLERVFSAFVGTTL